MTTELSESSGGRRRLPGISVAGILGDGLLAGMVGASAIALWFLGFDALTREPLFTPSVLGRALLYGDRPAPDLPVDLAAVAVYTAVHGALFLAFGTGVCALRAAVRHRMAPLWLLPALFVGLEAGFLLLAGTLAPGAAEVIGQVPIALGNGLAAAAMGAYLLVWSDTSSVSAPGWSRST